MENILTYFVVFGFGIAIVSLYLYRKDKQRLLPISEQQYAGLQMQVKIEKEKSKLIHVIIGLRFFIRTNHWTKLEIELIDQKRNKKIININSLVVQSTITEHETTADQELTILFNDLQDALKKEEFQYQSFRFVVETSESKKYKSHELAYSERWQLFKLDSGTYN